MIERRKTRQVKVGSVTIGGDSPVSIQSMTKTDTADIEATVREIRTLATAGCEIVRVAVPTIPFHPQFAIAAIEAGFDKIRWNPGNIRNRERVREVVERAKERRIPIRVGVNVGSLDPECLPRGGEIGRASG